MNAWYETENMGLCYSLSEDVSAPELRRVENSAIRAENWLTRFVRHIFG